MKILLPVISGIVLVVGFVLIIVANILMDRGPWRKCAWCEAWYNKLGEKRSEPPAPIDGMISHGICPHCKVEVEQEMHQ